MECVSNYTKDTISMDLIEKDDDAMGPCKAGN